MTILPEPIIRQALDLKPDLLTIAWHSARWDEDTSMGVLADGLCSSATSFRLAADRPADIVLVEFDKRIVTHLAYLAALHHTAWETIV